MVINVSTIVLAKMTADVITSLADAVVPWDGLGQIARSVSEHNNGTLWWSFQRSLNVSSLECNSMCTIALPSLKKSLKIIIVFQLTVLEKQWPILIYHKT